MSTRDLRFRIIGDASGAKGAFTEVAAGAATASAGLRQADVSATNVGKTFSRSGKLFKASGKVIKNSGLDALSAGSAFASIIPQASGLAAGLGALTIGADAFGTAASAASPALAGMVTSMGPLAAGTIALAPVVIGAAAAYALLHNDISAADEAMRHLDDEQKKVKAAHRDVAVAALNQRDATRDLETAELNLRSAHLNLWQASHDLAEVAKENGKNSLEYRSALLQQQQAEQSVNEARRNAVDLAQKAIAASKRRSEATDKEAAAVRAAKSESEKYGTALRLGFINGEKAAQMQKRIKDAADAESDSLNKSASRHRANATEARKAADALRGDATPAVQDLRKKLIQLSNTELDMANAIAAMHQLQAAASTAAGGVQHVYDLLRNPPSVSLTGVAARAARSGGSGNPGIPSGKRSASKSADEFLEDARRRGGIGGPRPGERNPVSFQDRAGNLIDARHRDDSEQDKRIAAGAERDARRAGVTNPDKLSAISDRAVAEARRKELSKDLADVRKARGNVLKRIATLRTRLAGQRKSRRRAKKDDRPDWDSRIADTLNAIRGLWDQYSAMGREIAEIRAEFSELGFDVDTATDTIAGLPDSVPGDEGSPPTERDSLEAAAAQAALTPGVEDDRAAAAGLVGLAQRELDAAVASGDPRRIRDAAVTLKQAQDNLDAMKDLTAAIKDNTDAQRSFGGSNVVSYRGQDEVLRRLAMPSSDRLVGVEVGL